MVGPTGLTVVEFKETAKTKGVSSYMTKQDVVQGLDESKPVVDYSG